MKFTTGDKTYDLDPDELTMRELDAVDLASKDGGRTLRTLATIWVQMRRDDPTLKFEDVEFTVKELAEKLSWSDEEARARVADIRSTSGEDAPVLIDVFVGTLPEDQRARVMDPTVGLSTNELVTTP